MDIMIKHPEYKELFNTIDKLLETSGNGHTLIICIEGRSGSGKSMLGRILADKYECNLFHTDDFFLRAEQRTAERLAEPGGNIDFERMNEEIFAGLRTGHASWYRPYLCAMMDYGVPVEVTPKRLNIVEGSYSAHPKLDVSYDLKIFLDISPEIQSRRILERECEMKHKRFMTEWIPKEELYFEAFGIKDSCHLVYRTDIFYN